MPNPDGVVAASIAIGLKPASILETADTLIHQIDFEQTPIVGLSHTRHVAAIVGVYCMRL